MVSGHCVFVADDDGVRQGDVVVRRGSGENDTTVGVIVTADCDIVQSKSGGLITCLQIVPSHKYLEDVWAPEQLRRVSQKVGKTCRDKINKLLSGTDYGEISESSLCEWLGSESPEEIVLQISGAAASPVDQKLVENLKCLSLAVRSDVGDGAFRRLREAWKLMGRNDKNQRAALRDAFDGERGFPDYVLVPDIPSVDGIGHAVLLRAISSLRIEDIFLSEADARAAGMHDKSFYRIARFNDTTRYAIAQKLAFLFSRIGMPSSFEGECSTATELLIETLYGVENDV